MTYVVLPQYSAKPIDFFVLPWLHDLTISMTMIGRNVITVDFIEYADLFSVFTVFYNSMWRLCKLDL